MSGAAERRAPGTLTAVIAGILLTVASFAALGRLVNGGGDPIEPPLRLGSLRSGLAPGGRVVDVTVEVTSHRKDELEGAAWWMLVSPGPGEPWERRRAFQSETRYFDVRPGERLRLAWSEPPGVPAGTYEVWAYTHVERDGTLVHSDGVRAPAMVRVATAVPSANGDEP